MSDRLPWFRCFPSALLGALAGLDPDEGLIYVTALLRIYETGEPVLESARTLSRRTGLTERRAGAALERLLEAGKLTLTGAGKLDSASTHAEIGWQKERHREQSAAGRASAAKRQMQPVDKKNTSSVEADNAFDVKKHQQNQQNGSTHVERPINHKEEDTDQKKDKPSSGGRSQAKRPTDQTSQGQFLSADWRPSESDWEFAIKELGSEPSAQRVLMKFRNYWFGKPGKDGRKRDWGGTWRNWVMKEADGGPKSHDLFAGRPSGGRHSRSSFDDVAAGLARVANQRGLRLGSRQNGSGQGDGGDHQADFNDPEIEDAHWTPAEGHRAAHH